MPNHIPLNHLEAGESFPGRSFPCAGLFQYRHTTSLMQELSAEDFNNDEEVESGEQDMVDDRDDAEEEEMEECEREGLPPRSIEEMVEDISRTLPHKRTEVLSPVALAEQRKKSRPTCKSYIEQPTVQHPPPPPPTAQAITFKPMFPCWLCGNYEHIGRDCPESIHSHNSLRKCTNWQETSYYSILCSKQYKPQLPNDLNAIQCDFCFGHYYGSECNKKKESTSVKYSNRIKTAIRTSHNISLIPEGSN